MKVQSGTLVDTTQLYHECLLTLIPPVPHATVTRAVMHSARFTVSPTSGVSPPEKSNADIA